MRSPDLSTGSGGTKPHVIYTGNIPPEGISLSDGQENIFRKLLASGIYKELYNRKAITGTQLNDLLNRL